MSVTVAVVGGGYGGITVATMLDEVADVVLVEPRESFVHNIAALRGVVDAEWTDKLFYPYDRLLKRGRVIRDRAVQVDGSAVTLRSGERIAADYIVLATGSAYPFPAKIDEEDTAEARERLQSTRAALTEAEGVLLLGAGPVGLELAGEIRAQWPDKAITIVDPAEDVVTGDFPAEFRTELRRQLADLGVDLVLGTSLRELPPTEPGQAKRFTVETLSGKEITADVWLRCYGVRPNSGYLTGELATARRADGHVEVTAELRLPGHDRVFAVGDLTAVPEAKMARSAGAHAGIVAGNIRALIDGTGELSGYEPAGPFIAIPLGPTGGSGYLPDRGVLDAETTSQMKGADLLVSRFATLFGTAPAAE